MSQITKIWTMPIEVRSGTEDNAFASAMRLREALEIYQFAGEDHTSGVIGQDVTLSVVDGVAQETTQTATGGSATISGLAIDDSGYEINITIDSEETWKWIAGDNSTVTGQFNVSGMVTLGYLQSVIRAFAPNVVLSVAGTNLVVENNPVGTSQIVRSETAGQQTWTHLVMGGSTVEVVDIGKVFSVDADSGSYRVSHPDLFEGDSSALAAAMTGSASRTKFSTLAEFATFVCKSAGAYQVLSSAFGFTIRAIYIDQLNDRLIVSPHSKEHGAAKIEMTFQVDKDKQFGE